jgi:ribonuclease VapC
MATYVLDSSALLAYFLDATGAETVETVLARAATANRSVHVTELTYSELKSMLLRSAGQAGWQAAVEVMTGLPLEFHPGSRQLAEKVGDLRSRYQLGITAAFSVALCKEKRAEFVTGDHLMKQLEKELKICWIVKSPGAE